jgi:lysophospholipase L1-like esterase
MTAHRFEALLVSALTASVLVLSGCALIDSDDGPRVLVVGDSVTVLSEDALRDELDWADTIDFRATNGLRTDELLDGARAGADEDPDIGMFMPGYNDVMQERVDNPALEEMMDVAAALPCAVWLLLPADGGLVAGDAERWNQRVRDLAEPHGSVHVSDGWKRLVETTPEFTLVSEVDGVHPNAEGRKAVAAVMTAEAEKHCR